MLKKPGIRVGIENYSECKEYVISPREIRKIVPEGPIQEGGMLARDNLPTYEYVCVRVLARV